MAGVKNGWEQWEWDETLFAGTAQHYRRGRMPYAERLADVLADALGLDGRGRLLDVGCGPGVITLRVAHLFDQVVGLDPDADMLVEGSRHAAELKVDNAVWLCMRAEEISASLAPIRTATFAASFHWMDRLLVAQRRAEHSRAWRCGRADRCTFISSRQTFIELSERSSPPSTSGWCDRRPSHSVPRSRPPCRPKCPQQFS